MMSEKSPKFRLVFLTAHSILEALEFVAVADVPEDQFISMFEKALLRTVGLQTGICLIYGFFPCVYMYYIRTISFV